MTLFCCRRIAEKMCAFRFNYKGQWLQRYVNTAFYLPSNSPNDNWIIQAEASREARAKVIAAEGEQKASRALREASEIIGDSPAALQLRYLQVNTFLIFCCLKIPLSMIPFLFLFLFTDIEYNFNRKELDHRFPSANWLAHFFYEKDRISINHQMSTRF